MAADATRRKLFKGAVRYFPLIAQIVPRALQHRYSFVSDEWFRDAWDTGKLSVAERNHIIVLELLEKSHLAAVSTLIRIERWADAVCIMHDTTNFPGFASAMRGLIENGGDSVDGLLNIAISLAKNHRNLSQALAREMKADRINCAEIERPLDHYVHARRTGKKERHPVFSAKASVDYVRQIGASLPDAVSLYHRLCAIVHPSNASIDWLFDLDAEGDRRMKLAANDAGKIAALCDEFPEVADVTLQRTCNSALLILRVLHKFRLHPKIPELRKLDWSQVRAGREIERLLQS
jgi:hypothetical protein